MTDINLLIKNFLVSQDIQDGINLIQYFLSQGLFEISILLCDYLLKKYGKLMKIINNKLFVLYTSNKINDYFNFINECLRLPSLTINEEKALDHNRNIILNKVVDFHLDYPKDKIMNIKKFNEYSENFITFSITTCKRFDLFEKTMNSFINCCLDINKINRWICVDDNSHEEDREKMKELYPFFEFIFKDENEKGHSKSMNIIRDTVTSPYLIHMEDDWQFFEKRHYITECLEILVQEDNYGQCLFNKNYAEIPDDYRLVGGKIKKTISGRRYYEHQYVENNDQLVEWLNYHKVTVNDYFHHNNWWRHFSFRPSMLKTSVYKKLGRFIDGMDFEKDYANKYFYSGYKSVFLPNIYCKHIGRLTSERDNIDKKNAYELNNQIQFSDQLNSGELSLKMFVVNLKHREDRLLSFMEKCREEGIDKYINVFEAVNGMKIRNNEQLQMIFDGNDYNMRKGIVGCALSHLKLYIENLNEDMLLVFEDDIDFNPNFIDNLNKTIEILNEEEHKEWDLIYLSHHLRHQENYKKEDELSIKKVNYKESIEMSLGGTHSYIISKRGMENILEFINETGMTNAIDTVQQKFADKFNVYYTNNLLTTAECFRGEENKVDSNIQYVYDNFEITTQEWLDNQLNFFAGISPLKEVVTMEHLDLMLMESNEDNWFVDFRNMKEGEELIDINSLKEICNGNEIKYYSKDDRILVTVKNRIIEYNDLFFHRFKKGINFEKKEYSIDIINER